MLTISQWLKQATRQRPFNMDKKQLPMKNVIETRVGIGTILSLRGIFQVPEVYFYEIFEAANLKIALRDGLFSSVTVFDSKRLPN